MKTDILPKGMNHSDIWGSFREANLPGPCEHCGRQASSRALTHSRKVWRLDLCATCADLKAHGHLGNPKQDIRPETMEEAYGEDTSLPF